MDQSDRSSNVLPPTLNIHEMTLDAVHVAYLIPSTVGATPIPISKVLQQRRLRSISTEISKQEVADNKTELQQSPPLQPYLLVGRQSTTSDIRISHNSISRKHALLYYDINNNNLILYDLGSKYGTTINQHRISDRAYILQHSDRIQFGNVRETIYTVQLTDPITTTTTITTDPTKILESTTESVGGTVMNGDAILGMVLNDDTERPSNTTTGTSISQQQHRTASTDLIQQAGEGLLGRAKHQAEIDAMISSLDDIPTYTKATIDDNNNNETNHVDEMKNNAIADTYHIPITNQIVLESSSTYNTTSTTTTTTTRKKNVPTCISIDPVGARFMMGCTDSTLRLYDFGGLVSTTTRSSSLSSSHRHVVHASSFKSITPEDGYWPVSCRYSSNTGDRIIVGTGSVQPIIFDREGTMIIQFVRGDMYVTDQSKTSGHTAAVTGVDWHPFERDIVITSSIDGSARLWNIKNGKKQFQMLVCDKVFQPKTLQGKRTSILCVAFHPSGREFVVGTSCGSIQIWNPTRVSTRPERAIYAAHGSNQMRVTSVTYNYDGTQIATRSADTSTTCVWNATKMTSSSTAFVTCNNALSIHEQANVAFSPDGKILCVGVASIVHNDADPNKPRQETGGLHFYNISKSNASCDPILKLNMHECNVGVVLVAWHTKINQIFVTCSDGQIIIYYNPTISRKGAIGASGKVRKSVDGLTELLRSKAPTGSAAITGEIITPLYNPDLGHKRKRYDIGEETNTLEPERPVSTKHKVGSGGGSGLSFQQFVADVSNAGSSNSSNTNNTSKIIAGNDPREALFKYNEGKAFVDRAYEGNKSKLAEKTAEQEDEESKQKKKFL